MLSITSIELVTENGETIPLKSEHVVSFDAPFQDMHRFMCGGRMGIVETIISPYIRIELAIASEGEHYEKSYGGSDLIWERLNRYNDIAQVHLTFMDITPPASGLPMQTKVLWPAWEDGNDSGTENKLQKAYQTDKGNLVIEIGGSE